MTVEGNTQSPFQIPSISLSSSKPLSARSIRLKRPMIMCQSERGLWCILIQTVQFSCGTSAILSALFLWIVQPTPLLSCSKPGLSTTKFSVHLWNDFMPSFASLIRSCKLLTHPNIVTIGRLSMKFSLRKIFWLVIKRVGKLRSIKSQSVTTKHQIKQPQLPR